ncbi:M20 metallopeptidase family protein [Alkaliphilus peptidifermentans]|uniref:Amidohydrolase n=1 Tax=Alkaliphilus peptidifermentans DSM 18978 TaxID=1120976 RepID=A0A1G5IJF7_9FIRM|nr:amidohydrolase [Alkaliphilus peptidifermentans]SCY75729.1 amidohydrolase [Alkaliphilus peptidifermentans DSM 18978]
MDIKKEIAELNQELIDLRRDFHKHPELGFEEFRTSEIIANYLKECNLEVKNIAKTGVVGLLKGSEPGFTIMLRADIDALPVQEKNDISYKSIYEGKMHACGHDGHTAMLLVAAKVLSKHRNEIKGNIKFIFQPNEEDAGAEIMINEGVLENPKVDAALGLHLWSPIESGKIGIGNGPIMASSHYFKLTIKGKGGHGGAPHLSIDPINCGMHVMQAVQAIQTREVDALAPTIITFCKLQAGSSPIIIPEQLEVEGSIRCLHEGFEEVKQRFERIIRCTCEAHQAEYALEIKCGNILLNNDTIMAERVKVVAMEVVGPRNITQSNINVMLGEDFAEFAARVPSAFYFLGVGNKEKNTNYPHHHPFFNIDEDVLPIGVEMHIRGALEYLNRK